MEFNIINTEVYGLEKACKASGNPMRTKFDRTDITEKDMLRAHKLGSAEPGAGHDNFLKGILVQFDVTAPLYWWKQAQRYHWFDFISSQSTMHCLLKFTIKDQCVSDTDERVVAIVQSLVDEYNSLSDDAPNKKEVWRKIVASLPCGFCLGATMTTNYQQLKTMFNQRKTHKLTEWHTFCDWCLTLPEFSNLTGCEK